LRCHLIMSCQDKPKFSRGEWQFQDHELQIVCSIFHEVRP
jgi:hypothetical protein